MLLVGAGGAQELCLHIKSNKSKQEERERGAQTSVGQNLVWFGVNVLIPTLQCLF